VILPLGQEDRGTLPENLFEGMFQRKEFLSHRLPDDGRVYVEISVDLYTFDEREQKHPVMGQIFLGTTARETDGLSRRIEHMADSNRVIIPHIVLPRLRGPRP
jgi:hypothetical protein